jgi:hypothetical protein
VPGAISVSSPFRQGFCREQPACGPEEMTAGVRCRCRMASHLVRYSKPEPCGRKNGPGEGRGDRPENGHCCENVVYRERAKPKGSARSIFRLHLDGPYARVWG